MNHAGSSGNQTVIRWALSIVVLLIVGAIGWFLISGAPASHSKFSALAQKWHFTAGGAISGGLALASDATLYAPGEDGMLYALDPSGNLKWKFEAGRMTGAPAIGPDGTIYVSTEEGQIFAVNPAGAAKWSQGDGALVDKETAWKAAALDQTHIYLPRQGTLRAIQLTTGTFDWTTGISFQTGGSASILPSGLVVYVGYGRIDAVNYQGMVQWEYPAPGPPSAMDRITSTGARTLAGGLALDSGISVAVDGTLYACVTGSRMIALTPEGSLQWEFKPKVYSYSPATPLISSDKTIYFSSGDGTLYALNTDGTQKWATDTGGLISATPVLAADGTIYVVNGNGLVALSPEGKILDKIAISGGLESSPTIAPDGTLYVASRAGEIMAFAGQHGGLMNSAWPKFQADLANTGRASPL